ncbi:MAG: ABC transporter permease [Bdellovibrionales bacterium]|nr:ABC transporter permease [Bdellovibrionales bacterium]
MLIPMANAPVKHHYKDLIIELLRKELRVRYKRLALGYLWSVMSPLMYAGLYYVVFSKILRIHAENYPLFLVAGLFPWQWMTNTIMAAPTTFISNYQLIKKTLFPRFLIPVVISMQDAIHFLISLPVIILFMILFNGKVTWAWLYAAPLMIFVHFGIAYSLNLMLATLTVFFRDLERFLQIGMAFLFYLTPVLYSETMIPEQYQPLIMYHPFAPLMINWRNLFMTGEIRFDYLLSSLIWCGGIWVVANIIYKRLSWRFAEVL